MNNKTIIKTEQIFEDELRHLMDDEALQQIHLDCLRSWCKDGKVAFDLNKDDPHNGWILTRTDYWDTKKMERLDENLEAGYYGLLSAIETGCFTHEQDEMLQKMAWKIESYGEPTDFELCYYVPRHSCHHIASFAGALASAWKPDGDWVIATNGEHSTAYSNKYGVFDLLLSETPDDLIKMLGNVEFRHIGQWHEEHTDWVYEAAA
jgi:hypothetical protein